MSEPTQPNPDRADDARLHTALYGVPCEWRKCEEQPEGDWMVIRSEWPSDGDYPIHPCFESNPGWWKIVPFYSTDTAAAHDAEGDLPVAVRMPYLMNLNDALATQGNRMEDHFAWKDECWWCASMWSMRRATPTQIVEAMLHVLGVE